LTSSLSYPQGSAVDPIYDTPEECRSAAAKEQANFTHDMIQGGDIAVCMGKPAVAGRRSTKQKIPAKGRGR